MKTIKLSFLSLVVVVAFLVHIATAQAVSYSLTWIANPVNDAVTAYNVYERVGSVYTKLGSVGPTTLSFSLGSPTAGVHFYAVTAVNITAESPKSAEAILPAAPTAPTGLKISSP